MSNLETFFILMFAAVLLVGVAQKLRIPYPIALVIGGGVISFIPGLHPIEFDPNLILVIVLPPVLYYGAFGISFREFKKNWGDIFSLALGLVVATTVIVAIIFKWLFPQFHWALAFAFGAIVSPPDAISAITILKGFQISSRLVTLLEGESLVNDASALILYRLALTALFAGTFSLLEGIIEFSEVVFGGVIVGIALGVLFQLFSRRYLEPVLGVVFSFLIPYITYISATFIGGSGVLAVVISGLIGSKILVEHHSSLRRIVGYANWDIFTIFMNCFVFIVIGLQLRTIVEALTTSQMVLYAGYATFITLAMVIVRMLWVYAKFVFFYTPTDKEEVFREALVIGWSGMRGIVSLAAAIALPFNFSGSELPLEGRNEIIFMTFVVIFLTLTIPGLSLPSLIRWLKIKGHSGVGETEKIRALLSKIAEEKLRHLHSTKFINEKEFEFLKAYFIAQSQVQEMSHAENYNLKDLENARLKVIRAQRKKLLELWKLSEIDDKLLAHLENELDMIELHVSRAELK